MKENNTKNVTMPNIENREHRKNNASTGSARNSGKAKSGRSSKCSGGIRSRERTRSNGSSGRNRNSGKIAGQSMKQDTASTLLLKNNKNFAELFNRTFLVGETISPEELREEDIKETARLRITKDDGGTMLVQYRDVVKSVQNGRIFAVLGVEHQSEIDYAMPFRILEVDFINYARQMQVIRDRHNAEWKTGKEGGNERKQHTPKGISTGEYLGRFLKTDRIVRCVTLVIY